MAIVVANAGLWKGSYSMRNGKNPSIAILRKLYRKQNMLTQSELEVTLNGAAAGSTASVSFSRVLAQTSTPVAVGTLGGRRSIEAKSKLSRATVAGDKTAIDHILAGTQQPTFPGDRSGNGK